MKIVITASILLNLALGAWLLLGSKAQPAATPSESRYQICVAGIPKGETVPTFSGTDLSGAKIESASFSGSLVLVNFWSLSCAECLREIPLLNGLFVKYRNQGFTVVGVNTDVGDERERIKKFMQNMLITYPLILDAHGTMKSQFFVDRPPASYLVGRDGRLIAVREEWLKMGDDGLSDLIKKHLE